MSVDLGVRLLTLRCDALAEASTTTITDLVDYFEADLIYIIEEKLDMRIVSTVERTASCSVVYTRSSAVHTETVDGVTVSIVSSLDFIGGASTASGRDSREDVNYVICDEIQTSADSVTLDVSLDGLDHLARFQNRTDREVTFLTRGHGGQLRFRMEGRRRRRERSPPHPRTCSNPPARGTRTRLHFA